jgi:glycosyltransferase involved in cell wall biosynthesis
MKNQLSEVCVIMPVYNGAKTIELAIKSLLCQTYTQWNCVIVNDGSKDNTKQLLDAISDKRFKIIHLEKNKGRGFARQVALENTTGDFLTYLDADDFYHPEKIECQVEILEKLKDVSLVSCAQGSFDSNNKLLTIRGLKFSGTYDFKFGDAVKFIPVTSMIRLDKALEIKYNNNLNASEDVDYFSRYLENEKFYIINKILYYYAEFESVSYSKAIEYDYNNIKAIISVRTKLGLKKFFKTLSVAIVKSLTLIILYPFLGKNFFLKRRGFEATIDQQDDYLKAMNDLINIDQLK